MALLTVNDYLYATVSYADIFGYPLTSKEARFWFASRKISSKTRLTIGRTITKKEGFFTLRGRESLIKTRMKRSAASANKWRIARAVAENLLAIPTIRLVGVTGALAMDNATEEDDIDFFVVTAKGALWITRGIATVMLDVTGKRRKPYDTSIRDKICLNMFMSEDDLGVRRDRHDLFSAHEVLQMKPIGERRHGYRNFLRANTWTRGFLPNAWSGIYRRTRGIPLYADPPIILVWLMKVLEMPAKLLQMWYMRRRRTSEIATDTLLQFHPRDVRPRVIKEFAIRMKQQGIPLDKIFFGR